MEQIEVRHSLIKAIDEDNFFKVLNTFKFRDNDVVQELIHLHNETTFDLNSQFLQLKKSNESYNFYSFISLYCEALPKLNSSIIDVISVFIHIKEKGLPAGDFEQAYFIFCNKDISRSKIALDYLFEQLESSHTLIGNTIMAAAKYDAPWVMRQLELLIRHQNSNIRWQAYMATGRVLLTDGELPKSRLELLEKALFTEIDCLTKSGIFRSAGFLAKQIPYLWPQINLLLGRCLENLEPDTLYEASQLLAYAKDDLPDNTVQLLLSYLKKTSPNHRGILNNISHFISDAVKAKNFSLAEELLEALLLNNNELRIDEFQYLTHDLTSEENSAFLNRIITKWFLMGEDKLYEALHDLLSSKGLNGNELNIDNSFSPLSDAELYYLAKKAVGWFYFHPISAISYLLSIIPLVSTDMRSKVGRLIYDPLILSYMGKGKEYLRGRLKKLDTEVQVIVNEILSDLDCYRAGIANAPEVKELRAPQRELDAYWKDFNAKVSQSTAEAQKGSFMELIGTQTILYGNDVVNLIHAGEERNRSINTMQPFSHSYEMPKMNVIDPEGVDIMLRVFRTDRIKNETDS